MTISIRLIVVESLIVLALLYGMINLGMAVGAVAIPFPPGSPSVLGWIGFSWVTAAFASPFVALVFFDTLPFSTKAWIGHGLVSLALFGMLLLIAVPGSLAPAAFHQAPTTQDRVSDQLVASVEESLGDLRFRSPDADVLREITLRLMRRDTDGAVIFLMHQTGLPQPQATERIATTWARFQLQMKATAEIYGRSLQKNAAWRGISLLLALIASALGGLVSARLRARWPIRSVSAKPAEPSKAA